MWNFLLSRSRQQEETASRQIKESLTVKGCGQAFVCVMLI